MTKNKTARITIRLSKKQDIILRKRATEIGFSISEYMLKSLFGKKMIINNGIVLRSLDTLCTNDNKLENNINQIAKKFNSNLSLDENEKEELRNLISEAAIQRANLVKNIQEVVRILSE